MTPLHQAAHAVIAPVLTSLGIDAATLRLIPCPTPDLGDASTNIALQSARVLRKAPLQIAQDIAQALAGVPGISKALAVPPGYVNLTFDKAGIEAALAGQSADPALGIKTADRPERIVIDFGGPNIKPMHVGHLRSLVIGESLRRILAACGHDMISDIHLGDWGLPMGMILSELQNRFPDSPWFTDAAGDPLSAEPSGQQGYPAEPPVGPEDLAEVYPAASKACKEDPVRMEQARATTAALQAGDPRLMALWSAVVRTAKIKIMEACGRLGAHFDLELGESDAQPEIPSLIKRIEETGLARRDGAALVFDVVRESDTKPMPPLVLAKEDGSALYATTDLATIAMRVRDLRADRMLYVVDGRQELHFEQVFRVAKTAGISGDAGLEHIAFGTVNGPDGKPFKTRDGGVMRLEDLLDLATAKAHDRLIEGGRLAGADAKVLKSTSEAIGLAALRIADLSSHRTSGYNLDLDRALSFEGKTGPYLLYAAVRLRAILAKAREADDASGPVGTGGSQGAATDQAFAQKAGTASGQKITIVHETERRLALKCLEINHAVSRAAATRSPHELTSWAFDLAAASSRFYVECPVATAEDPEIRASRLALADLTERCLVKALHLLGCVVPDAM